MASSTPSQTFTLDRKIFNESLYSQLRNFWFAGLPPNASSVTPETSKRWFGRGPPEETLAFDNECRSNFGHALEALSPTNLSLPHYKSHADDLAHAEQISGPLIAEIRNTNAQDPQKGAETLLSLCLLLDQMPRNIFRDPEGLRLVYTHYDRISWTLFRSALALKPNPMEHSLYALRPIYKMWLILPFEHAEDRDSQVLTTRIVLESEAAMKAAGDDEAVKMWQAAVTHAKGHKDIIDRFGRYPHRNECLGRENTKEEEEWLVTGDTFGVKQNQKKEQTAAKNEL